MDAALLHTRVSCLRHEERIAVGRDRHARWPGQTREHDARTAIRLDRDDRAGGRCSPAPTAAAGVDHVDAAGAINDHMPEIAGRDRTEIGIVLRDAAFDDKQPPLLHGCNDQPAVRQVPNAGGRPVNGHAGFERVVLGIVDGNSQSGGIRHEEIIALVTEPRWRPERGFERRAVIDGRRCELDPPARDVIEDHAGIGRQCLRTPRDMLVRPHEHKPIALVFLDGFALGHVKHHERNLACLRRRHERRRIRRVCANPQQRKTRAELVIKGQPFRTRLRLGFRFGVRLDRRTLAPDMRRADARPRRLMVGAQRKVRRRRAVVHDDRRLRIPVAELHPGVMPLRAVDLAELGAERRACGRVLGDRRALLGRLSHQGPQLRPPPRRLRRHQRAERRALHLVGVQRARIEPALDLAGQ